MSLLNIRLRNLLHHKVRIDVDFLAQIATSDAPLARDGEHANRRFSIYERVDALGDVGERELISGLEEDISEVRFSCEGLGRLPDQLVYDP
jgi:hypothetical protein